MALEENGSNGLVMPVAPMYGGGGGFGGNGFGGDGWWILLLFILLGGWNNGGNCGGGFGGGFGGLYPWMNQANLTSEGFQNQLMNDNVTSIEEQGGSSNNSYRGNYRRSYDGETSNRYRRSYDSYDGDMSSRRGRDSLGRYTSDGYSRHSIVDQLEDLSEQTNDERVKSELRKMISKMEK